VLDLLKRAPSYSNGEKVRDEARLYVLHAQQSGFGIRHRKWDVEAFGWFSPMNSTKS
jgi:hypothetical protein